MVIAVGGMFVRVVTKDRYLPAQKEGCRSPDLTSARVAGPNAVHDTMIFGTGDERAGPVSSFTADAAVFGPFGPGCEAGRSGFCSSAFSIWRHCLKSLQVFWTTPTRPAALASLNRKQRSHPCTARRTRLRQVAMPKRPAQPSIRLMFCQAAPCSQNCFRLSADPRAHLCAAMDSIRHF